MLHRLFNILLICFLAGSAFGQYPATGNKSRLGWQTTADGLVWRGAIADTATIDPVGLMQAWALVDTASGVLYQYRGKAWRPVLAYAIQPFDSVVFNNNEGDADSAELKYNAGIGSLVYGANDGAQIPVLPGHWYVRNDTSVTLTKGTLVRAVGTIGASGRIKVRHMIGDNSISAEYVMGIVVKDIPAGEDGYIMFYGKIRKLNTNAFNEGDLLYPDDFTPGALTNAPVYFKTPIAFVVHKSINQGVIAVRIQTENYLSRLHDVTLPGLAAQNILRYSGQYWIPGRDTSIYDFDARLKGNRTVLMNNFDMKFRNQYSENNYVQIRPTFVMVSDSTTGEQVALNKYGIAGPVTGGYLSEVRLANGVYLNGSNSRFVEGLDTGDGYDVAIDTVGRVRFRVSAAGAADSLYGKTSSGLLTAIKPNYLAYTDTASMLSTYLRPSEILAGTGITLSKDSTVTISAPTTLSSSTAIIDVAEVVADGLSTLRLPWDGAAVVGIIKTGLYLTSGVNEAFVQHELIPNGDKGDITTSAGGAGMTIDAGAVTNSKANFTTLTAPADTAAQLLGVTTDGRPNTVGLAGGLTLTGGFLTVTGLAGGTVTSVQGGNGIITDPAGGITAAGTVRADTGVLASKVWANNALALKLNAADTASLSNRINLKLNAADTASLSTRIDARVRYTDTTSLIATKANLTLKLNAADTASLSNRINLKLNAADTASLSSRIDAKQNTITGAATSITTANLTASRALVSDSGGKVAASGVTATELGYLGGVTSAIQAQLNGKQNTLTNPITGTGTANQIAFFNGTTSLSSLTTSTYPSLTELSYVKGVTSAIQTQLNGKLSAEVDGSITNEGSLSVGAGTSTTSVINSNTSGSTGVTISAGNGMSIAESGSTITLTNAMQGVTIATSGSSTVLTATSNPVQIYRGTSSYTYTMPSTSNMYVGQTFEFKNDSSTSSVNIISSGLSNTLLSLAPGTSGKIVCVSTADNNNSSFDITYEGRRDKNISSTIRKTGTANLDLENPPNSHSIQRFDRLFIWATVDSAEVDTAFLPAPAAFYEGKTVEFFINYKPNINGTSQFRISSTSNAFVLPSIDAGLFETVFAVNGLIYTKMVCIRDTVTSAWKWVIMDYDPKSY